MRLVDTQANEPKIEVLAEQQQRKTRFIGSMLLRKGQTLYGYDMEKNVIYPVKFDVEQPVLKYEFKADPFAQVRKKVNYREGHMYVVALNEYNAERKFANTLKKMLEGKR